MAEFSRCDGGQLRVGKKVISDQKRDQKRGMKDVVVVDKGNTIKKWVRISTCAIQNNVAKVKGKHPVFKTNITGIHTCLLIDNSREAELIDKSFARSNKISTINWKDHTIKFNFADCMKKSCLLHSKPWIKFAVGYKLKHEIGPNKPAAGGDIDIHQVSAKHFF